MIKNSEFNVAIEFKNCIQNLNYFYNLNIQNINIVLNCKNMLVFLDRNRQNDRKDRMMWK